KRPYIGIPGRPGKQNRWRMPPCAFLSVSAGSVVFCRWRHRDGSKMVKSVVTARVRPETKAKLRAIAQSTKRSEAGLAGEAIEAYVEVNEWQKREIAAALGEAKAGAPGVSHERMVAWLDSWGGDDELPPPEPKKSA